MKKNYILPCLTIATLGLFAFQQTNSEKGIVQKFTKEHQQAAGGQFGFTGAPGEANCTQCHSGSTQDGTSENTFFVIDGVNSVTEYIPGNSYTIRVQMVSAPNKKGFSAVALDGTDSNAGSFTGDFAIGGTQDFSSVGREYVSHTSTSNTGSQTFWAWTWDAPATGVGDVTFYVASNSADDNSASSGDIIYLSQHVISDASVGISEHVADASGFTAGYSSEGNSVTINFNSLIANDMYFNLVDLNGKSVYSYKMANSIIGTNKQIVSLPAEIKNGMYVVHCFVNNKAMSANIIVAK
ncbi:MAG: hypothetical protein HRT57_02360 [Crocinitomicaceae bacterium]|nr:hypothetical protein [Crocinitomicaceae bacterium]